MELAIWSSNYCKLTSHLLDFVLKSSFAYIHRIYSFFFIFWKKINIKVNLKQDIYFKFFFFNLIFILVINIISKIMQLFSYNIILRRRDSLSLRRANIIFYLFAYIQFFMSFWNIFKNLFLFYHFLWCKQNNKLCRQLSLDNSI